MYRWISAHLSWVLWRRKGEAIFEVKCIGSICTLGLYNMHQGVLGAGGGGILYQMILVLHKDASNCLEGDKLSNSVLFSIL